MTPEKLQELLSTPLWLFAVMILASLANGLKQVGDAARNGTSDVGPIAYLFRFWPETIGMVIGNVLAFAVLAATGQLNLAAAIGIGYGVNSAVDLMRPGGRSAALAKPQEGP